MTEVKTTTPDGAQPGQMSWVRMGVDYGPLIGFGVTYFVTKQLLPATGVLVALSILALIVAYVVEKRVAFMALLATGIGIVFGTLALVTGNADLVKIKPTVVNALFGVLLIGGELLSKDPLKAVLGQAMTLPDRVWKALSLRLGGLFLILALANEWAWRTQSDDFWVVFHFAVIGVPFVFMLTQMPMILKGLEEIEAEKSDQETSDSLKN